MSLTSRLLLSAAMGGLLITSAQAQTGDPVDGVLACRSIEDIEQRLACFDQAASTLAAARSQGDIVVVSREDVDAVERDSFGFNLPSLPRFSLPSLPSRSSGTHDALAGTGEPAAAPGITREAAVAVAEASVEPAPQAPQRTEAAPETAEDLAEEEIRVVSRDNDGGVDIVTMRIERMRTVGYNTTLFYMSNGQVWRQTDNGDVRVWGDGPHFAEISRAALGSYQLRINGGGRSIRVRRQE
jgi:hypothetical protein